MSRRKITIEVENPDKHEIEDIGNSIHYQLVGNQDYIDSNIVLHIGVNKIELFIDDCKFDTPTIVI